MSDLGASHMCCSVLHCVSACVDVDAESAQYVRLEFKSYMLSYMLHCCTVLQRVRMWMLSQYSMPGLGVIYMWCSVLQCVALCCNVCACGC